jgi:uncharacterized protein (TIGR03000 family)
MYTVVLMAALGTSVDMPDFGRRRGCHGCSGCCGGYAGCCGGGYGGCCGGGGCYGGGCCGGTPYAAPYSGGSYPGGYYGPAREQVPAGSMPPKGTAPPKPKPSGDIEEENTVPGQAWGPAPATIVVTLPADARLSFDGTPTQATSTRRVFNSPPLQPGQDYHYILTAQIVRDGRPLSVNQRVDVRSGQTANVSLRFPTTDMAASR